MTALQPSLVSTSAPLFYQMQTNAQAQLSQGQMAYQPPTSAQAQLLPQSQVVAQTQLSPQDQVVCPTSVVEEVNIEYIYFFK